MITHILLTIEHKKPIADLTDLVAGRVYTMDNIEKNGNLSAAIVSADDLFYIVEGQRNKRNQEQA